MEVDGKFDHGNQQPPSLFSCILIKGIKFILETCPCLSSLSSHPLFSFSVASQVLILLYLPRLFIRLFFSPVLFYAPIFLVITFLILSHSVGLAPPADKHDETLENKSERSAGSYAPTCDQKAKTDAAVPLEAEAECSRRPLLSSAANCSIDWSPKWPLEVIYEDYEGVEDEEEEEEEGVGSAGYYYSLVGTQQSNDKLVEVQGLEEWGLCLPDSDSGSSGSSEREYPDELPTWESVGSLDMFRWEEEEEGGKEGMIEILLGGGKGFLAGEEESLIEIDLYGASR